MKWELPLLLGFILLFSAWISFPSDNQYFYFDSEGIKHYILTPEISDYDNSLNNLTNVLFNRYENPWITPDTFIPILLGSSILCVMNRSVLFDFIYKLKISFKLQNNFQIENIDNCTKHQEIEQNNQKNLFFNYLISNKLNIKKILSIYVLTSFLIIFLLNPFYVYQSFATEIIQTNATSNNVEANATSNNVEANATSNKLMQHQIMWKLMQHQIMWKLMQHQIMWKLMQHQIMWKLMQHQIMWKLM